MLSTDFPVVQRLTEVSNGCRNNKRTSISHPPSRGEFLLNLLFPTRPVIPRPSTSATLFRNLSIMVVLARVISRLSAEGVEEGEEAAPAVGEEEEAVGARWPGREARISVMAMDMSIRSRVF